MLDKDYYTAGYLSISKKTLSFLKIQKVIEPVTEVRAIYFSNLNSLFIILLAALFLKWREDKYNSSVNFE